MSKYAVFFTLKGEAIARAMEQPSDRVLVVSKAVESAGGKLEAYYLMFGQYDGFVIVDLPDSRAAAATSLAVASTGAFEHLETHELIEAEDLNPILEQAKGITSQLPAPSPKPGSAHDPAPGGQSWQGPGRLTQAVGQAAPVNQPVIPLCHRWFTAPTSHRSPVVRRCSQASLRAADTCPGRCIFGLLLACTATAARQFELGGR